jgi:hypothetical protein
MMIHSRISSGFFVRGACYVLDEEREGSDVSPSVVSRRVVVGFLKIEPARNFNGC